ncbi:hypothetical protein jhhlp_008670 [Lomentospora prolificans]|uniref:C2H2-type domain-containing protein n=1 Tax=Lomentospora prolificans TaxID=41688 RepID=A0A2N3MYP3_9PEZI|nr:hypothetical protein jhhlp_008670 [Lomentospora prolificans]
MARIADDDEFSELRVLSDLFPDLQQANSKPNSVQKPEASPPTKTTTGPGAQLSTYSHIIDLQRTWMIARRQLREAALSSYELQSSTPQTGAKRLRPDEDGSAASSSKRRILSDQPALDAAGASNPSPSRRASLFKTATTGTLNDMASNRGQQVNSPSTPISSMTPPFVESSKQSRQRAVEKRLGLAVPIINCDSSSDEDMASGITKGLPPSSAPATMPAQQMLSESFNRPSQPRLSMPTTITPVPLPPPYGGAGGSSTRASSAPGTPPVAPRPAAILLSKSKRSYCVWYDENGRAFNTGGALLPDGYKKHGDPERPWICPIFNCSKRFRDLRALGGHFTAGHRGRLLNDNCDGTLSIVGEKWGTSSAIVISQEPRDPKQQLGPPLEPKQPPEVPVASRTSTGQKASSIVTPITPVAVPSPLARQTASHGAEGYSSIPDYLKEVLPKSYDMSIFTITKSWPELSALPRRRSWPRDILDFCPKLVLSTKASTLGLLLYLTGSQTESCEPCRKPRQRSLCIVTDDTFPESLIRLYGKCCAMCFYRHKRWHLPHKCTHGDILDADLVSVTSQGQELTSNPIASRGSSTGLRRIDTETPPAENNFSTGTEDRNQESNEDIPEQHRNAHRLLTLRSSRLDEEATAPSQTTPGTATAAPQNISSTSSVRAAGNVESADILAMEEWEVAPGRIRSQGADAENVVFSNSYLTANQSVQVADGVGFNVIFVKPGGSSRWEADRDTLRICSVSAGKLKVKLDGDVDVHVGPNGMFKILPGTTCVVENRLYLDAVLHITTLHMG